LKKIYFTFLFKSVFLFSNSFAQELSPPLTTKAKLTSFSTKYDKAKITSALKIVELVINSDEFKNKVLAHQFKGQTQYHENEGLSNLEIYQKIMTGEEDLIPGIDHIMNYDLALYRTKNPWSSVKGYTNPGKLRIYINKKFFRRSSYSCIDVASNLVHEWLHKLGFGHDFNHNADRPFTVPYAIGDIAYEVGMELGLDKSVPCP